MDPTKSVFNQNNNNNNANANNNWWGNPQVGNVPFPISSSQTSFPSWGTNSNNNNANNNNNSAFDSTPGFATNDNNSFGEGFTSNNNNNNSSAFGEGFTSNDNNNSNQFSNKSAFKSVFENNNNNHKSNASSFLKKKNHNNSAWWTADNKNSSNTNATNNKSNSNHTNNTNSFWTTNNAQNTNNNDKDSSPSMDADESMDTNKGSPPQEEAACNDSNPKHNASPQTHSKFNGYNPKNNSSPKPKSNKLEATEISLPFLGNWNLPAKNWNRHQGQKPMVFVAIRHKQPDPNQLVGLVANHPKHDIKVSAFGTVSRSEAMLKKRYESPESSKAVLHGLLHVNNRSKGGLSIMWYGDNFSHQHYWNQHKCKGYENGECRFGNNCKFAHVDPQLAQALQANNKRVAEIQQLKHNKKQFKNKVVTYTDSNATHTAPEGHKPSFETRNNGNHRHSPNFKATKAIKSPKTNKMRQLLQTRQLKSYKNPSHRTEGMSLTTTYFDNKGQQTGTFISTQDAATSNTVAVPQQTTKRQAYFPEEPAQSNNNHHNYTFEDEQETTHNHSHNKSPSPSVNQSHEPGKCYLMCPQKESNFRIMNGMYKKHFECDSNGNFTKYSLIKEYSKSNAGQKIPLQAIRCGPALRLTMQYLLNITLNKSATPFCYRYHFLEDRIRAMCKDVYTGHLGKMDEESTIEVLEIAVRFRLFCHVLMCHMDQSVRQQQRQFPASTLHQSTFLALDVNTIGFDDFIYSGANNLNHLHNLMTQLSSLYAIRVFDTLSESQQNDEIEMYCMRAYYKLVNGAMNYGKTPTNYHMEAKDILCTDVPSDIRRHKRITLARNVIDAYSSMNRALFFKLYHNRLTYMEQAVLYPLLDSFRLVCIKTMSNRGNIRLPPGATYSFEHFVRGFGFYYGGNNNGPSRDATDFLRWYGGFSENDIRRMCANGLTMEDFGRIRPGSDARFASRDAFLLAIEGDGLQRILQGSSHCKINPRQFNTIFTQIESAHDISIVDQAVNTLCKPQPHTTSPPKQARRNAKPPLFNVKPVCESQPQVAQSSGFAGFDMSFINNQAPQSVSKAAIETQSSASRSTPSMQPEPAPSPPIQTVVDIKSSHDELLQSMVKNQEWKKLLSTLSSLKHKYQSHPSWNTIKTWIKSYIAKQREQWKIDWDDLKSRESKRDWNKFYSFTKKWNTLQPKDVKKAVKEISKNWCIFKKNEIVFYNNTRYKITAIRLDFQRQTQPSMKLTDGKNPEIKLDMFDTQIISEAEHLKQEERKRIQREQEEIQRKMALKQQREREERRRKEEEEKKRIEAIAKQRAIEEERLAELRAKLLEEERKRRIKQQQELRKKQQIDALKRCHKIYKTLRLKRFIAEWKYKAHQLAQVRKHYRLDDDDDILTKPQSLNDTLILLQDQSPLAQRINPRKRREPDYSESNYNYSYIYRAKRARLEPFQVSWNAADVMQILYQENKQAVEIMSANNNHHNINGDRMDLILNVLISPADEEVLKHFGCNDIEQQLQKRIYSEGNKRLHYYVISDDKIRAIGAQFPNSIRGFQGYVHKLSPCALLDFNRKRKEWCLNTQRRNELMNELRKDSAKIADNIRLLHDRSGCSMLIFIECQPLYTALRNDEEASNTLIEFNAADTRHILRALNINEAAHNEVNSIKIMGIPSWPNAEQHHNQTFNYGMKWLAKHSARYPIIYKTQSSIINTMFEKIFDSKPGLFSEQQKIELWNSEIDKITQLVMDGMHANVSWPSCCFDDKHELMTNEVIPPPFWNNDETKHKILSSLQKLKIMDSEHKMNPKRHIIQCIAALDRYWWSITDVAQSVSALFVESSLSDVYDDASTFTCKLFENEHETIHRDTTSSSKDSSQLQEFEQLLNDISQDFDNTIQGFKTCSQVIHSINNRINGL